MTNDRATNYYRHQRTLAGAMRRADRLVNLSIATLALGYRDGARAYHSAAVATLAPWRKVGRRVRFASSTRMSLLTA